VEAAAQSEDEAGVCREGRQGGESAASAGGLELARFKSAAFAVHAVDMWRVGMWRCWRLLQKGAGGGCFEPIWMQMV
jgi:hypothetical protein